MHTWLCVVVRVRVCVFVLIRYQITDKVPKAGHPDWKRVVAVIVQVRDAADGWHGRGGWLLHLQP